jgi:peptide/nickel transport system permease protein/oligopeptide transport system permease protein
MSDPTVIPPSAPQATPAEAPAPPAGQAPERTKSGKERSASLWADAWRDLRRNPVFLVAVFIILVVTSMALFPQLWTSVDPTDCDLSESKLTPQAGHIFGTDPLGCDYYAQTIYGTRPSLTIAVLATIGTTFIGGGLGLLAGFYGGWMDTIISRITDIFFALPFLLGAIVLLTVLKSHSVWAITSVLIILGWTTVARIMRSSVISAKNLDYVQAARSLGAADRRLMTRHILPNSLAATLVIATIALGGYVSAEATLSFLGVGLVRPNISWGVMINDADPYISSYPHLLIFPGGMLIMTVLAFILAGDALRDALDPKLR